MGLVIFSICVNLRHLRIQTCPIATVFALMLIVLHANHSYLGLKLLCQFEEQRLSPGRRKES